MKLYSFYTPSHKILVDKLFLPSLKDDYEIILEQNEQKCASGEFMTDGWIDTMLHKVDIIIRGIKENEGRIFLHSDVDIQFFKPTKNIIVESINGKDLLILREFPHGTVCPGFMAMRGNEKNLKLWQRIKDQLIIDRSEHDQAVLNDLLVYNNDTYVIPRMLYKIFKEKISYTLSSYGLNAYNIKWAYLPQGFYSHGAASGDIWEPGAKFYIPKNIVLHHANWTRSVENKIAMLHYVNQIVASRSKNQRDFNRR